jgi:hypothetical protein
MRKGEGVKGWNLAGDPVDLLPWQEDAVRALLGWDEGNRTVTLISGGKGAGKSVVLYTAGRYVSARAKGRPLKDDPVRNGAEPEAAEVVVQPPADRENRGWPA